MVDPNLTAPFSGMSAWFMDDEQPRSFFEMHHGEDMWDMAAREAALSRTIGDGMTDDSRFVVEVLLREGRARDVFSGVRSMVDVGGGTGTIAKAIAAAFPHVECSVLDLPHVVAEAPAGGEVRFIEGDMFEHIPPADAVLLKSVMHDWRDDECVKILRRCKEAIPSREAGGKVIIINMVVGFEKSKGNSTKKEEAQALYDLFLMVFEGGEREEHEWEKIFLEAGFSGYSIIPMLGIRSIIEVYP
ncbi:O-methyltransferase ZRP4 [Triticum urartu]|nr:O-methyltransferase ZRP4 [Triticum urartu]